MTKNSVYVINDSKVTLWGLHGKERLCRQLGKLKDVEYLESPESVNLEGSLLVLRGDFLIDPRILPALLTLEEGIAVSAGSNGPLVAVKTRADEYSRVIKRVLEPGSQSELNGYEVVSHETLVDAYDPKLLKYDPPAILPIDDEDQSHLEREIFDGSYKGVTDFVTKWLWPLPARYAVKHCVKLGISANQVTLFSFILAVFTGLAFWKGQLVAGLLSGWLMTFLHNVDGRLARVTVTSSKSGDIMDHGLDLIHPPLWYLAWGLGIQGDMMSHSTVMIIFWVILAAYVGGRLCEGAFDLWLAPFRLFLWQPLDSFNRLITARRNPNLVLLSISIMTGRPDLGLYAVALWHVLSTLFLCKRIATAVQTKRKDGELKTWFNSIDPSNDRHRLEVRLFTRLSKDRNLMDKR